ncbi:hypothetical protein JKP88DRAFT_262251 [Tribonema minus]|uniref:Transaldolase n=1 Tax=Tribonema minus TaxID=303371 RepID=A0A835Z7A2_9STRA|nr:hypothetical protein JKP88DRAFT_262251 [Tribonema minus]
MGHALACCLLLLAQLRAGIALVPPLSHPHESLLQQLKRTTSVWADTADSTAIKGIPASALDGVTTNPSLVYAASASCHFNQDVVRRALAQQGEASAVDRVACALGIQLLSHMPHGRVCTQLDMRLQHDSAGMIAQAYRILDTYAKGGAPLPRIMVKVPATWAGLQATRALEEDGVRCLVTLVTSLVQATAACDAGATILATYVGRVGDWHKRAEGKPEGFVWPAASDPGVALTRAAHLLARERRYATEIMGASFRSVDQKTGACVRNCGSARNSDRRAERVPQQPQLSSAVRARTQVLAMRGACDHVTVSPALLTDLLNTDAPADADAFSEAAFMAALAADAAGASVLASSAAGFERDTVHLDAALRTRLHARDVEEEARAAL